MKCTKIKILPALLILIFATTNLSQAQVTLPHPPFILGNPFSDLQFGSPFTDLSFLGAGARAHAMGGAFYAISDDPTAISWNPAGLVQMEKEQMSLAFHHTRAENNYDGNYDPGAASTAFSGDIGQSIDQLAFASVVIPFELRGRQFVGSASVPNSVLEMRGVDFRDTLNFTSEINGRLGAGSLGLATKLWPKLWVGLTVNIYGHGYDKNGRIAYQISPPPIDTVMVYTPRIISSFSGWNITTGGMVKLEKLRLAALYKFPFTKKNPLKEDLDGQIVTNIIIAGVKNPPLGAASGYLYKTRREWILPGILGLGASYQVTENFLVAVDFDYKPFSKAWARVQSDILDPSSSFEPIDLKWNDINQFRIGGEYKLKVKRFTLPLRLGYRNDPKVWDNLDKYNVFVDFDGTTYNFAPGEGSQVKGNVVTFGTGVAFGQVAFDIAWELGSYDFEENGVSVTNEFDVVDFSRKSDFSNNRVIFNFTGVF